MSPHDFMAKSLASPSPTPQANVAAPATASPVPTGPTRDHCSYVGASDAAPITGAHPYRTALDVWAAKTGRIVWDGNEATEAGDEFERPILGMYARKLGAALEYTGTLFHPQLAHVGATPDAIRDRKRTVQVKFVGYNAARFWKDEQDGPEGVPPELIPQVHQEAALARLVLGIPAEVADVVAQIGTERRVYEIPIDHELGEALIAIADDFWTRHVVNDVMPEVVDGGDIEALRRIFPAAMSDAALLLATDEVKSLVREYDSYRGAGTAATKAKERIGAQLCALIGDGLGFVSPGDGIKVTWAAKQGLVSWREVAREFRHHALLAGVKGDLLDAIERRNRGEPTRVIDVRVKEG